MFKKKLQDWTEEVEKNIKLDEISETTTSFSLSVKPMQDIRAVEVKDSKKKSRRRDRRFRLQYYIQYNIIQLLCSFVC